MTEKSHVGMGYYVCPICYEKHDEVVLLDTRLKQTLERDNFMGFALCSKHDEMRKDYLALVVVANKQTGNSLKPEDANPTGEYAHIRREVVKQIFSMPVPDDQVMAYVDQDVLDKIKRMTGHGDDIPN